MVGADSLLPVAGERRDIIGSWLLTKGDYLGTDALTLLEGLLGQRPTTTQAPEEHDHGADLHYIVDTALKFRRCGATNRVLVARPSHPPQLYWVSEDAASLLELLEHKPLDEVVAALALRWGMAEHDTHARLRGPLADLRASGLVTSAARPT